MTPAQSMALSLGVSFIVAALGLATVRLVERRVSDPGVRERAWGAILYLSALPPFIVAVFLLLPPRARIVNAAAGFEAVQPGLAADAAQSFSGIVSIFQTHGGTAVLVIAGLLAGLRCMLLVSRLIRLRGLMAAGAPAAPDLRRIIDEAARRMKVSAPPVRVSVSSPEVFLAGPRRPILVVPAALAAATDSASTRAICAHELAHLKRGDHRTLWLEEILLSALAINPLLGLVRDHRAAAREEACDAVALTGADDDVRRDYARSLLAAIRNPAFDRDAPALTFTSARRTFVMHRLKAILSPASPSARRPRLLVTGVSVLIAAVAGAGSFAVAGQRQAEPAAPPQAAPPASGVITNPTWAHQAAPRYPAAALEAGVTSGRVSVTCAAQPDGSLSGCSTAAEDPAGSGFAAAAIEAALASRLSPRTMDSAASGSQVTFTFRFQLADPA